MQELKRRIREALPRPMLAAYRYGRASVRRWQYRGGAYYCNVCESGLSAWVYVGPVDHCNRVCPVCHSYGRHRLMALVLEEEFRTAARGSKTTLLHFAPEIGLQRWIRRHVPVAAYLSADLDSPEVDIHLDVQDMNLADETVDVVLLSHVLEHVENDGRALAEICRILIPGGKLFLQVPLSGDSVTQDAALDTPEKRLALYGKTDHVRLYGDDIQARLTQAGFDVTVSRANDERFGPELERMALDIPPDSTMLYDSESSVYTCRKR